MYYILKKIFCSFLITILINCTKSTEYDSLRKVNVSSINNLNKKENKMDSIVEFSDLFNEGTIIKFTPKDINSINNTEIQQFRNKLLKYEEQHPLTEDFRIEYLEQLINNETFFDAQYYIDSSWLKYFIKKYKIDITELNQIMRTAILYEDYNAVKILINQGYIVSSIEKRIVQEAQENKTVSIKENEKDGYETYLSANSKIDEISKIIKHYYLTNSIHDPDGYTNLRKEKSTKSEIIQQIKSGERIEVLDNSEDWFLIKTKEGKKGYIHKSRIKSDISKPISLHLYSRPDWNSFAQEIKAVGEIEYIHKVSNWDYVKIGQHLGYLPSNEENNPIRKHTLIAEEEDILTKKKKGFWNKLFG